MSIIGRGSAALALVPCLLGLMVAMPASVAVAGAPSCAITNERNHKEYMTLQAAQDAAHAYDTIAVKGTCYGTTVLYKSLAITGVTNKRFPGPPTLDGGANGSVIAIQGDLTVSIDGLTIRNGATSGDGGGIATGYAGYGAVTLTDSMVTGNSGGLGGGISTSFESLTLIGSTVTGNTAYRGGGIFIYTGSVTLNDSTVTANTAVLWGGGIDLLDPVFGDGYPLGSLTLVDSIVSDNQPDDCAGPTNC